MLNQDELLDKKTDSTDNVDAKTIELVNKRFKEAAKYREPLETEWRECEDFYDGNHWKDKNRSFKNLVFPLVEQEVSVLTDSLPSTDILARRQEREEDARVLEASVHFTLDQQAFFLKLSMALRQSLKTGTGFLYIDFDPDADDGQGLTTIKNVPWEHIYLDPAATEIDEASFVGIKFPVRVEEAKRKFPKFKDQIKANKDGIGSLGQDAKGLFENRTNYLRLNGSSNNEDKYKLEDMCEIEEAWIRDYEMVSIPEEETGEEIAKETEQFFHKTELPDGSEHLDPQIPDIGRFKDHPKHIEAHHAQLVSIVGEALGIDPAQVTENDIEGLKQDPELGLVINLIQDHIRIHEQYLKINPKGEKPKYSCGLRLVIKIGSVIVYDGDAPVDDGIVPLVPFYCYKNEKSIWGVGEVKNILPSQKSFNEMDNAEYESLHLTSNPGWVIDGNSGVDPASITNKRGKVYVINPGTNFRRLEPGQTSPQLSIRKSSDQSFMQIITGMNEASQGRQPGGVTAAKAIERLQQQTNGRIRLKTSSMAMYSMPRLGKLIASRNAKYWTTERFMRVTDKSTGQVQLIKFDPEQIKDLEYDVRIVQSSLAGTDKEAQAEVLAAYVEKGWISPKVYFQIVEIPNKAKILEALEQSDQQLAAIQQLQAENEQLKALINGVPADGQQVPPQQTAPQA
jgi:hypothetical protein